jgi:antitoxin ParD1/3/4
MSSTLNLSLTKELRAFIDENSGDGTLYATPSEFLRDVLREKKQRVEAAKMRDAILDGFKDLIAERSVEYRGSVRDIIKEVQNQSSQE